METDGSGAITLPAAPTISTELCSGCGRCVAACPLHLISLEPSGFRKHAVISFPERCTSCGRCKIACPIAVIHS